ncbi:phospholipase A and acyltransferase 1-like [Daphnia pulex]|uniref:phospholipase A and acyltransferase 1-like n=1 Tax=Daphnia pulex TaxID=6669 RepID=UPI001EDCFEC2|nr:phospholipase A and acyltransferase 1-like [Daphnia pulex]
MKLCYSPDEITATKGDLIEFRRCHFFRMLTYYHFAVYTDDCEANQIQTNQPVGDRYTVGVDSPRLFFFTRIVEKTVRNLCNVHGCRVNNLEEAAEERGLRPFRPDVIVERAREFLREDRLIFYHVLTQNCEHFATKCRYGEAFSLQVSDCCPAPFTFVFRLCSAVRDVCYSRRRPEVYILGRTIDEVRQNEENMIDI